MAFIWLRLARAVVLVAGSRPAGQDPPHSAASSTTASLFEAAAGFTVSPEGSLHAAIAMAPRPKSPRQLLFTMVSAPPSEPIDTSNAARGRSCSAGRSQGIDQCTRLVLGLQPHAIHGRSLRRRTFVPEGLENLGANLRDFLPKLRMR